MESDSQSKPDNEYGNLNPLDQVKNLEIKDTKFKARPLDLSGMPESAIPKEVSKRFLRIVGIRFHESGRVYDFNAGDHQLKIGDAVVADLESKGSRLGWVSKPPISVDNEGLNLNLKRLNRLATDEDIENIEKHSEREKKALIRVKELVSKHDLEMHILEVEYSLDLKKSIVYFTSEQRVDFRTLLKDLLVELKSRVELRQVGVRDETKLKGGLGACGEEQCCSRFLNKFHPVSIKMAKNQGLSLKPTKVSGNCGRLKCCLAYEDDTYTEANKKAPRKGSKCSKKCGSGGCGVIQDVDPLRMLVTVRFDDGTIEILKASEIVEQSSKDKKKLHPNETLVATADPKTKEIHIPHGEGKGETTELERVGNKDKKPKKKEE